VNTPKHMLIFALSLPNQVSSPLRILRGSLESSGETEVFAEVQTITTTTLDSING